MMKGWGNNFGTALAKGSHNHPLGHPPPELPVANGMEHLGMGCCPKTE